MKKRVLIVALALVSTVVLASGYFGYLYAVTPDHMRRPALEHYHMRTQIIVDGQSVNFGDDKFQVATDSSSCSTEVSGHPIDFHDHMNQMTHIHWKGMTGGEFLKYFGWNLIGGEDELMGRRYDQGNGVMRMMRPHHVQRFGNMLPAIPGGASFYIYTGGANSYERKDWDSFLRQDMETFFGRTSSIGSESARANILNWLFPRVSAHGGEIDMHDEEQKSEEELTRINNLIGNVVIFVQKDEPSDTQIREHFNNLVPLHDSVCGG